MRTKMPEETRQVIVRRYEHYVERRQYGDPWRTVIYAAGGFFAGIGAARLWLLF